MITNEDIIKQLDEIHDLAIRDYPYPQDIEVDGRLTFTLGMIAGMTKKAIADYNETRRQNENHAA